MGVGVELDLGGQVRAGIAFFPHRHRRHLGVAQVEYAIGVVDALRQMRLIFTGREYMLSALTHHDRGASVLTHGEHSAC